MASQYPLSTDPTVSDEVSKFKLQLHKKTRDGGREGGGGREKRRKRKGKGREEGG